MQGGRWALVGGSVYDGTGSEAQRADLVVADGRIEAVHAPGRAGGFDAPIVDVTGLSLAPGFIDVHSHSDNAPLVDPPDTSKILQGVTTEVVGNCGFGLGPATPERGAELTDFVEGFFPPGTPHDGRLGRVFEALDTLGYITNYAPLVGHGALRAGTIGWESRLSTTDELAQMCDLLDEAIEDGAFGLSSGLIYAPGTYSDTHELGSLSTRLPAGMPYVTHMRGEGAQLWSSLEEALRIARPGIPVHISHLKVAGSANWGTMGAVLDRLDGARADGHDVRHDVYPYTAGSTILAAVLPPWAREGGKAATLARLRVPTKVEQVERDLAGTDSGWENLAGESGWDKVVVASSASGQYDGTSIAAIAAGRGATPARTAVDILLEEELEASMIIHSMRADDLRAALTHPLTMIGSDGLPPGTPGRPHPRGFGTFPRVLGRFAIRDGWLGAAEAVRKMTSLAADSFGIPQRGRIVPGYVADIVAFDESSLLDTATFENPFAAPSGIPHVMVGGRFAVLDGRYTGSRDGRRLRPSRRRAAVPAEQGGR